MIRNNLKLKKFQKFRNKNLPGMHLVHELADPPKHISHTGSQGKQLFTLI